MTKTPPRAWQRMLSGRRLDILDPSPLDVEIEDIAHGLARVARWNGQTTGPLPFNVAQHSVIVADLCAEQNPGWGRENLLAALLHDAPEYVIGDMISPFKAALGARYREVEHGLQRAIHLRFGLPPELPKGLERQIKKADRICAYFEATQIAGFGPDESKKLFGDPSPYELTIEALDASASQALFLERFEALSA
jgi:5'-deoxynucleotidase YfbR-like HD superfamily hydrolase